MLPTVRVVLNNTMVIVGGLTRGPVLVVKPGPVAPQPKTLLQSTQDDASPADSKHYIYTL